MDITSKLRELLTRYIEEYKEIKETYQQKKINISLYEELIQYLSIYQIGDDNTIITILLDSIYGNNIYIDEFYRIIYLPDSKTALNEFINKIKLEYTKLKIEVNNLKQRIIRNQSSNSSAHKVRANLKYQTKISNANNDFHNIKRIINYYEISGIISNREELLYINELELHNRKVATNIHASIEEQEYTKSLYNEIPNILTIGFQEHDIIEISRERTSALNNFSKEIISILNDIDIDTLIPIIEHYKKYNLDINEYNYIIIKVLDNCLEELITRYELLLDKEIYKNRKDRNDVIKDYYNLLEKYIILMNYYNQINDFTNNQELEETIIEEEEERRLIYSRSHTNISKSKFISDMGDIAYEYYNEINDLIISFKQGKLGNNKIKTIQYGNKSDGHIELKEDNVRIVLKRVKENIYNVLGVFIKKANNEMGMYKLIMNRITPDVSTEEKLTRQLSLAKITEDELEKLVEEKGRKNGRK